MLDAIIGPAQVGVRDLDAVSEVELDAGPQRVSLWTDGVTLHLSSRLRSGYFHLDHMQGKKDQPAAEVLELRCHIGCVINTLKVNMNRNGQKFSRENKWQS